MPPTTRVLAPLCLTALLAGCGPARNAFPPVCPTPKLVPGLADLTRYNGPGPAHDITDLVMQAKIVSINGSCQDGDTPAAIAAKVRVGISVQRGPAMAGRDADMPVFLAMTIGQDIRDKRIFPVHVTFPSNVDHMTVVSPDIDLSIPVGGDITGASYSLIAGFQLTPEELNENRQTPRRP
jgi:hypothetical protein